jgi:single-strand DNA-binding protein
MANQIQLVIYEGYLADDPEMKYTPSGVVVTNFRIGSTHQYKDREGVQVKEPTWLKVVAWNKLGEIVNQLCAKGSHVIVTGRLRPGENGSPSVYELKSGGYGASFEIIASEVRVLKGKENAGSTGSAVTIEEEDFPF